MIMTGGCAVDERHANPNSLSDGRRRFGNTRFNIHIQGLMLIWNCLVSNKVHYGGADEFSERNRWAQRGHNLGTCPNFAFFGELRPALMTVGRRWARK